MKQFLFSFLFLGLTFCVNAQVKYTIFGGANLNNALFKTTSYGPTEKTSATYGYHVGIGRKFYIEDNVIFSTGAIGMLKGYQVNRGRVDTATINTQYYSVEVPFLLQLNLGKKDTKPYFAFGPSLGFNLSGKDKVTKANGVATTTNMVFSFSDYARYEGSLNAIFGVQTKWGLFIEAKWMHGLGTIWNVDDSWVIKPRVASLTLGYTFGKTKKLAFDK